MSSFTILFAVLVALCLTTSTFAARLRYNDAIKAHAPRLSTDVAANTARDFRNYLRTHDKVYSADELPTRYALYTESVRFVAAHNARFQQGLESYEVEINSFADWTRAEWKAFLTASPDNAPALEGVPTSTQPVLAIEALPSTVDWREEGLVTAVKNQGQCGSCWTFSATGSMECSWGMKHGAKAMHNLSEQVYVDCLDKTKGCGGGWPTWVFQYVIANGGAESEAAYPYLATDGHACRYNKSLAIARFSSFVNLTAGDELALTTAASMTPGVSVCIDASQQGFSLYKSGVYKDDKCMKKKGELDHAVLVTGYGTDNSTGLDYYLVKNSWGPKWGDKGYIRMYRDVANNTNNCGIATVAAYPIAA